MTSVCYISRLTFASNKANVYNTVRTCEALAEAGARVVLVSADNGARGAKESAFQERYALKNNFEIVSLNGWSNAFKFGGRFEQSKIEVVLSNIALMREVWRRRKESDAVYLRDPTIFPAALFAKLILRKPIFFESHAVLVGTRNKYLGDKLAQISRGVIAITHALADYNRAFNRTVIVSYCAAAEPERFQKVKASKQELRAKFDLPQDACVLGYSGNLTKTGNGDSYGLEDIIEGLPLMSAQTLFLAVGQKNPDETKELEALARKLGVAQKLRFAPWTTRDVVAEYILACDILLIPAAGARIGNAPTKMFDYLVSGRPIVAADTVAIREVLSDKKTALLVDYKNPKSWADAVAALQHDLNLRETLIAEAQTEGARYTWENRGKEILAFIDTRLKI